MTTTLDFEGFVRMLKGGIDIIKENHEYLSQLDTVIGDGDHGVSMLRAMKKLEEIMAETDTSDLKAMLDAMSWALLGIDGGATGPLYGMFFLGMAQAVGNKQELDNKDVAAMFASALASIQQQTKAQVGDKTMLDALIPAVQAMQAAAEEGKSIEDLLARAAEVAKKGAESTKGFAARFGRAKNQGDRTIGHQDPGATSTALLFKGFYNGLTE